MMRNSMMCSGLCITMLSASAFADGFAPEEAVVRLAVGVSIDDINVDYGTITLDSIPARQTYLLRVPAGTPEEAFENLLRSDARIVDAELNEYADAPGGQTQSFYLTALHTQFNDQWAWNAIAFGGTPPPNVGAGIIVAVIDTGLDATHAMFTNSTILPGFDFVDGDATPTDIGDGLDTDGDTFIDELVGHGTFQSGLIAQLAPGAALLPFRVLDGDGRGKAFTIAKAIYAAIDAGADIINMSLAMPNENQIVGYAIELAAENSIQVVAAAGNGGSPIKMYPAGFSPVIAVASTDIDDTLSTFSNYGGHIDLCAPGNQVISAVINEQFGESNGTSASTALVTAVLAAMKSANPNLGKTELRTRLLDACDDIASVNLGKEGKIGAGRVNITSAIDTAMGNGDINHDDFTNLTDLSLLLFAWGSSDHAADVDADGIVGLSDLNLLLMHMN